MSSLFQNKTLRLALAFSIGIIAAFYINISIIFLVISLLLLIGIYFFTIIKFSKKSFYKISTFLELIALLILISSGALLLKSKTSSPLEQDFFQNVEYYAFTPLQEEQKSVKGKSCLISVGKLYKNNEWIRIKSIDCKIFIKGSTNPSLLPGSSYIAKGLVKVSQKESRYFSQSIKKQLFYTFFVNSESIGIIEIKKTKSTFKTICNDMFFYLKIKLRRHIDDDNVYGVILALVLGDKSSLNKEIQKNFSESGTIHVLAVSGLHVGMVYLMLQYMLSWILLGTSQKKKKYIDIISIIVLWLYAGITGFSPSVLRASLMFSVISLGKLLNKQNSIFSSVGISAIVLLTCSPFMLFDLGFQLSYLAVIGISGLSHVIGQFIRSDRKILSSILSLTTASLAAQLATLPILLFVFKKFPVYFIPANWLVVPMASLILNLGVAVLAFGSIPVIGDLFIYLTNMLVKFINWYAQFIVELPFHQITNINISLMQTIVLALFIIFFFLFVETKKIVHCMLSLLLINILYLSFIL